MFSACASCYSNFSTPRALKRHERRYHPNTRKEQIVCKACNMPFSDQYYLKRHNMKYHNSKVSNLETLHTKTYQNGDSGYAQAINEGNNEMLSKLVINQQRNTDYILKNSLILFKLLEIIKELTRDVELCKEYQAVENKTKTYSCEICNKIYKHSSSLSNHKSRFHPKVYGQVEDQIIKDSPYYLSSLQTLNNA